MTKTIVVPLDGSELGERALPWAGLLAQKLGLPITLVRVVPWPELPVGEFGGYVSPELYDDILTADRQSAAAYLERKRSELASGGATVMTVVRDGQAAEGIHDVADETGAWAVIMSSHGRGGMARMILGSVAERLLQDATTPVMLAKPGQPERKPALDRILVPLDGSSLAERALDHARETMGAEATLVLVRVVEPIYKLIGDDTGALVVDETATVAAEAEGRAYLDRAADTLRTQGVHVETLVHRGRPANELLNAARAANVDAIFMTTHGRSGPTRWLMGSVADEVFRHADPPIFLVSARTAIAEVAGSYTVRDLMTRDVEVIREDEPVIAALRKLLRRRVSGAPVVSASGDLVGVISEHDLLRWHRQIVEQLARNVSELDPAEYQERMTRDTVGTLATRPATTIDEDAEMEAALRLLVDHRLRRLPVVRDGRLVGIISRADLLRGMAAHWLSKTSDEPH